MSRKPSLVKETEIPPVPFSRLDYVLCVVLYFLIGIAYSNKFAALVLGVRSWLF
jgi:hypothetical protein